MEYRNGLWESKEGLARLSEFMWQSWMENYKRRNYREEGWRLLPWLRLSGALTSLGVAIVALSLPFL